MAWAPSRNVPPLLTPQELGVAPPPPPPSREPTSCYPCLAAFLQVLLVRPLLALLVLQEERLARALAGVVIL